VHAFADVASRPGVIRWSDGEWTRRRAPRASHPAGAPVPAFIAVGRVAGGSIAAAMGRDPDVDFA
jgi:hypothetical protein